MTASANTAAALASALIVAASLLAAPAGAQVFGNPAGLAPDTPGMEAGKPAPDHANTQDKLFARQAMLGNRAEIELGKMAQGKASSPPVKEFAERMVSDHGKSLDQLSGFARKVEAQAPKDLDPEHKRISTDLQKLSGHDFDVAYMAAQIQDHQRTANLLQYHISFGQNEALKKYSMATLPTVMEHLEMAKTQFAALTTTAPRR